MGVQITAPSPPRHCTIITAPSGDEEAAGCTDELLPVLQARLATLLGVPLEDHCTITTPSRYCHCHDTITVPSPYEEFTDASDPTLLLCRAAVAGRACGFRDCTFSHNVSALQLELYSERQEKLR